MHPSWEKQRRSNSAWSLVLALGIVLVLIAAAFPFLVLGGQASCESLVQCVGTELLLFPAGFMLLTAWNTFRKRDPGKIRGLKIALAVVMPIALILGLFAGDIFIPPVASEDRIIDAGRGVLEFDSFLTIGWTIGFTLVGGVLRELRALRLKLVEIGAANIPDGQELMERSRKLGLEAFVEVATSIFLILISAFFAVRAILVGGPIS